MELVFIPSILMGHLLSAVELAKRILHRDHRLSITILIINGPFTPSTTTITTYINAISNNNPYPSRLNFHTLPPLSNPPPPSSPNFFQTIMDLQKSLVKQVIEDRLKSRSSRLAGFIFDMFYTAMSDIATHFKVPSYMFFTSGANFLLFFLQLQLLQDDQGVDIFTEFNYPNAEFHIPGFVNRVSGKVFPNWMSNKEVVSTLMLNIARSFKKTKGILVNSFKELESCGVHALFDLTAKNVIPRVYPVGPILDPNERSQSETQVEGYESIKEWLDHQPLSSVVFVCFGSLVTVDEEQVKEIAKGLEKSGHRFLWSLQKPPQETVVETLPEGFVDRTGERGRVIGWAPQMMILAHPSVGGFVSHCGWNSILESTWFGVPIATWPLEAEQQLNAFELVKELGLAVEIRMDYKIDLKTKKSNFIVNSEEIENGVKNLMNLDEGMKKRVKEMSQKSKKSLEEGGSSYQCLDRFMEDVWSNIG